MANQQLTGDTLDQVQDNFISSSPTAAQGAGGSPDQAKMAGTPAAKQGATLTERRRSETGQVAAPSEADTAAA